MAFLCKKYEFVCQILQDEKSAKPHMLVSEELLTDELKLRIKVIQSLTAP